MDEKNYLKIIEKRIELATNLQDILNVFKFIKSLNLKFKDEKLGKTYILGFFLTFLFLFLVAVFFAFEMSFESGRAYFIFFFICVFSGILYGGYLMGQLLKTQNISDLLSLKKVTLDNELTFNRSDKKILLQKFESYFFIFQQGNHSREITNYIQGNYKDKFNYHYFNLHYVNESTSTSKDANGNESTRISYSHHDLYGIIIPFKTENFIKISSYETAFAFKEFIIWQTSSISFNKKFRVYTDHEQAIAIFLKPKVIEQIENLSQTFPELDIEISKQGLLSISTPDQDLLNYRRKYGVDQLDLFELEIKEVLPQIKLKQALRFINFLREYHIQS